MRIEKQLHDLVQAKYIVPAFERIVENSAPLTRPGSNVLGTELP